MKRINVMLVIIMLSVVPTIETIACSCANVTKTFTENITENQVIFLGTIVEHIKIPDSSNSYFRYKGLTKIQVNRWYQNKMKSDTIYYVNGHGSLCHSFIENLSVGEQVIIKAIQESIYDPSFEFYPNIDKKFIDFMETFKLKSMVGYDICDVSILKVKDQVVIGDITKNYQHRRWRRLSFIKLVNKKWSDKLQFKIHNEQKYQQWKLKKFSKYILAKCNSKMSK